MRRSFTTGILPPSLSGGLLLGAAAAASALVPGLGAGRALGSGSLADRVQARADKILRDLLAKLKPRNEPDERAEAKKDENAKKTEAGAGELDPDVLAGITKNLARKHAVPDRVAGEAVMRAYQEVRAQDAARAGAQARPHSNPQAATKARPTPRSPAPGAVEPQANSTFGSQRRRRRPSPF